MLFRVLAALAVLSAAHVFSLPPALGAIACGAADRGGARTCSVHVAQATGSTAIAPQARSKWCWAAAISNVFTYYGHPLEQARIVASTYGAARNLAGTEDGMLRELNRVWVDDRGRRFTVVAQAIRPAEAAIELFRDRPVIVTALHHAVVLTSLTYLRNADGSGVWRDGIVRDPWPQYPGARALTARDLAGIHRLFRILVYD
ncbi:MAG: hypothetical protein GIW95_06805 [Candidatus Eremiobacteraeota bacterium]|nr:hypothetical protein [Candidatus Eremiobacteraeota bacterium]